MLVQPRGAADAKYPATGFHLGGQDIEGQWLGQLRCSWFAILRAIATLRASVRGIRQSRCAFAASEQECNQIGGERPERRSWCR